VKTETEIESKIFLKLKYHCSLQSIAVFGIGNACMRQPKKP